MSNQTKQTAKNLDSALRAKLVENKIIDVPNNSETVATTEENWSKFLNDFRIGRFGWVTKVQVLDEETGTLLGR